MADPLAFFLPMCHLCHHTAGCSALIDALRAGYRRRCGAKRRHILTGAPTLISKHSLYFHSAWPWQG